GAQDRRRGGASRDGRGRGLAALRPERGHGDPRLSCRHGGVVVAGRTARLTVVDRDRFQDSVMKALDSLPPWVHERLENIELIVEERPPKGEPNLLGRYHGVPLTRRGPFQSGATLPDPN